MKTFHRTIVVLFSIALLFTQCEKEPDPKDIVDIPDVEFLNYLIQDGVDINGDGKISYGEAEMVTTIYLDPDPDSSRRMVGNVKNMKGLEAFINLDTLHCCWNQIQTLDLSSNTELRVLVCWNSEENEQLEYLNISNNKKLEFISISRSQLTNLDVSNNRELNFLCCVDSNLPSLDVSNNLALQRLWLTYNQLTNLDVSKNTSLIDLSCEFNRLTKLDVSNNTVLTVLSCSNNALSSLDITNNEALTSLSCGSNEISSLDISNNLELDYIYLTEMQTLSEVCVWKLLFPPEGVSIDTTGSPNVYFTTDCIN